MRRRLDRIQKRGERRLAQIRRIRVPVAAEVGGLLLFLHYFEDVRKSLDAGHERVVAGLAEALSDTHEIRRLERLVAKDEHRVLEERTMDLAPGLAPGALVRERRERDAAYLGAQRPGKRLDVHTRSLPKRGQSNL